MQIPNKVRSKLYEKKTEYNQQVKRVQKAKGTIWPFVLLILLLFLALLNAYGFYSKKDEDTRSEIREIHQELKSIRDEFNGKLDNHQKEIKDVKDKVAARKQSAVEVAAIRPIQRLAPVGEIQNLAHQITVNYFGEAHWPSMYQLIMKESGFNPNALNKSSGACGIPQALPCSKIPDMSVTGQLNWMCQYIQNRYGTPSNALAFHLGHGWY